MPCGSQLRLGQRARCRVHADLFVALTDVECCRLPIRFWLTCWRPAPSKSGTKPRAQPWSYSTVSGRQIQRDVLQRSVQEAEQSLANYRELHERGIVLPSDDTALQRQRLDLLGRQVELETSAHHAEGQLGRLLALPSDPHVPLAAVADLTVSVVPINVETAVKDGLAMRPDMAMLRMLCERLGNDNLSTVRSGMQAMGGLLGRARRSTAS